MPLLGRFYIVVASLLLLATNAHLSLIALLAPELRRRARSAPAASAPAMPG